jgi:sulfite exporter TauE/SafE
MSKENNYSEITVSEKQLKVIKYTGLIFLFIGLYFILSNLPLFSSPVVSPNAGLLLIFITGLLTSVHCVGMCSGFVIAYTTKNPENLKNSRLARVKQHSLYNISRLSSYTFFGILAGLIGSVFLLTNQFRGYLSVFAGVFMVLYGLSTFIPQLRRFTTIRTPSLAKYTKNRGPVLFGLMNGLMPCGPLQAMLIYAAATGSAIQGGLSLLMFGLGTMPLMFGFGNALSFLTHNSIGKIMKVSAVVVMALGLVTLNRGLTLSGYALPSSNILDPIKNPTTGLVAATGNIQEINMTVKQNGWNPNAFILKKGVPVKWNIYVEQITSCINGIRVPKYGISRDFTRVGETITIEFTPNEEGTVIFTCPMGMVSGRFIVKNDVDLTNTTQVQQELNQVQASQTHSCGGSCGSSTCGAASDGTCGCGG